MATPTDVFLVVSTYRAAPAIAQDQRIAEYNDVTEEQLRSLTANYSWIANSVPYSGFNPDTFRANIYSQLAIHYRNVSEAIDVCLFVFMIRGSQVSKIVSKSSADLANLLTILQKDIHLTDKPRSPTDVTLPRIFLSFLKRAYLIATTHPSLLRNLPSEYLPPSAPGWVHFPPLLSLFRGGSESNEDLALAMAYLSMVQSKMISPGIAVDKLSAVRFATVAMSSSDASRVPIPAADLQVLRDLITVGKDTNGFTVSALPSWRITQPRI